MTAVLNHTIVPVSDKLRGAQVLADLLGLEVGAPSGRSSTTPHSTGPSMSRRSLGCRGAQGRA
jgi:hypothetical protein